MDKVAQQISAKTMNQLLRAQQGEVNEAEIYAAIAQRTKDEHNRSVLERLSSEEAKHAKVWQGYTGQELKPQRWAVIKTTLMARIFGFTFAVKMMENGEELAQPSYKKLSEEVPEALDIMRDEEEHEAALLDLLDEERLRYVGSMVLGLNDALVEMTGTLAGLTLAMQNTRLIALSGLITGIAATLSMASSEYLSSKSEGADDALKSSIYTGVAYLITVALLVAPYLCFGEDHYLYALGVMLVFVILILLVFNYYIAVAKNLPFKRRFAEMAAISLSVAALSFVIGILVKMFLGVDV